jgi:multiple sugar transport system substrate-binding protein
MQKLTQAQAGHGQTRRRRLLQGGAALGVGGIALAAAGCGGTGGAATGGPAGTGPATLKAGTKLTFASWGAQDVVDLSQKHAAKFREKFPGVTVDFISTASAEHNAKVTTAAASGSPIDVFYLMPGDTPNFAEQGQIRAIDDLVKRDKYNVADFFEKCIGQYIWKSKLYALPRGFGNQDIYLNLSIWNGAGLKVPDYDWNSKAWTVDEFLDAGQRLVRTGNEAKQVWGWTQGTGLRMWGPWVWIFGGDVLNKDGTACILDQPQAVDGLQFIQDMIHKHRVMAPVSAKLVANVAMGSGQLGMAMGIPANLGIFRKQTGLTFDVAPMPRKVTRMTSGGGVAWHMAKSTGDPAAAWELQKLVAGTDFQNEECASGSTAPPRKSVLKSACFVDRSLPPKGIDVMIQAPEFVHPDPQALGWTEAEELVNTAFSAIWDGSKTARQVAQDVTPQVNRILKQYIK